MVQGKEKGPTDKLCTPTTNGEASMQSFKGKEPNTPKVRHVETETTQSRIFLLHSRSSDFKIHSGNVLSKADIVGWQGMKMNASIR